MSDKDDTRREPAPWLQWMPNWIEFSLVFFFTLWPFVYSSINALVTSLPDAPFSEENLLGLAYGEAFILVLVVPFMYARGWTIGALGLSFERLDLLRAIVVWFFAYVGYLALYVVLGALMSDATEAAISKDFNVIEIGMGTVVIVSIVNGFFEELFVTGFLIQSIRGRFGVMTALNISILVRLSYHLYQGPVAVIGLVPFGLVFAWAFVRTGRLWPLVIAHIAQDILALGQL